MVLQLLALSGEEIQVELSDAQSMKDVRARVAAKLGCDAGAVLMVPSDGTEVVKDSQVVDSCGALTVINQSFDSRLIRLHIEESKQYSPRQASTLFYKTSQLLYDGNMVWERQDRQICDEMGYRGRTHDVYLSECGQLLFCRSGFLRRRGVPEYEPTKAIQIQHLLQKRGFR
ncbi:unnamed protein product [Cladocopium goreaui]|uniref:Phosphoenolpyruvate carboxylase n=1 Tax=Cladocopium goreaui TaxID=2562237 RepID=A0A9P1FQ35_9DINO|nr:unnamed protein product [Cladocopium goreaui]